MIDVKVSRLSAEILRTEELSVSTSRVAAHAAVDRSASADGRISRVSAEVLIGEASKAAVSRAGLYVAADRSAATDAKISRVTAEVLVGPIAEAGVSRFNVQFAANRTGVVPARVSRLTAEVLGEPPLPKVLPADIVAHSFLDCHNWLQGFTMETEAFTSMTVSGESEAEARRGLRNAPIRTVNLAWEATDEASAIKLHHAMREASRSIFQVPLVSQEIEATSIVGDTITVDTTRGEWHEGARLLIGRSELAEISVVTPTTITLTASVVGTWPAETVVAPVIDCSPILEPEATYEHGCLASLVISAVEAPGSSQLPFLEDFSYSEGSDYRGYPVFRVDPDWTSGISKGISRPGTGSSFNDGRAPQTSVSSQRGRVTHSMDFTTEEPWDLLRFWHSRKGRLYPFWKVDEAQDSLMKPTSISTSFITFERTTDFDDWKEDMDFIGIVLNDGSVIVREAAVIQDTATVFQVTFGDPVNGVAIGDVAYAAIARLSRFREDAIKESWIAPCVMGTQLKTIELLNENPT